ncbi:hypothetical protein ONS96_013421 [Cadophora gregata f. sp. sojae]|nr:hypothetical protein ONS96_013421 [Cadophora gregata f. sp. sojae]
MESDMEYSGSNFLLQAEALAESVNKNPSSFLTYLGTLEAEHTRLSEATDTLTARNEELLGIIERANVKFLEGRPENDKEFTDCLVKRIVQLNDENRSLKNGQEINKLLKMQNKMLQDEREYQANAVLSQAENIDKEYTRLSRVLYEYGVNAARLRNERDILRHNLEVTRKAGDIEKTIMRTEFNDKIVELNRAYDTLRLEIRREIAQLQQGDVAKSRIVKLIDTSEGSDSDDNYVEHHSQPCDSDKAQDSFDDFLDERLWQQNINITILQDENKRLQNELNATHHVFADLERSEAVNRYLRSEVSALAVKFSQVSDDALNTFNTHFEKAMSTAWSNFGKWQLAMDDQLHSNVDLETSARITAFSERVCEFGQMPLSKMEQDIQVLVESTCEHFSDIQEGFDTLGRTELDYRDHILWQKYCDEKLEKDGKEGNNSIDLKCLTTTDQETLVDDSTDTDSSLTGPLLASQRDIASECYRSESITTNELEQTARVSPSPEYLHNGVAHAGLVWRAEASTEPRSSLPQVGHDTIEALPPQPASVDCHDLRAMRRIPEVDGPKQRTRGWAVPYQQ